MSAGSEFEILGSTTSFSNNGITGSAGISVITGCVSCGTATGSLDESAGGATLNAAITSSGTSKSSKNPAGTVAG